METHYFLGIDWGKSKIGVALADDETRMAFAHQTFENNASLIETLKKLQQEYFFQHIVLGVPSAFVHAKDVGEEAKEFGKVLREAFEGTEVVLVNEMLSTKAAQRNRSEQGLRDGFDDAEAARILLQDWLDAGGGK